MNHEYFVNQVKNLRGNYLETVKKIISIEEEIEKTVFYLQNVDKAHKEKMFNMYKDYLQNLNSLRDELTSLMKDNLLTTQSFFKKIDVKQNTSAFENLTQIYQNVVKFFFDCYNPFYWFNPDTKEKEKKGQKR